MVMLPVPMAIASLKVTTRLPKSKPSMTSSAGLRVTTVGGVPSVAKFQVVSSAMPAKKLSEVSLIAVAAIRMA